MAAAVTHVHQLLISSLSCGHRIGNVNYRPTGRRLLRTNCPQNQTSGARYREGGGAANRRTTQEVASLSSFFSRPALRSVPQRYPLSDLSLPTTRWQGIATASRLVAQARATARTACGCLIARAIWE